MLLTQLDAQAMDSLFLGPDKQANILLCILNALKGKGIAALYLLPILKCFSISVVPNEHDVGQ